MPQTPIFTMVDTWSDSEEVFNSILMNVDLAGGYGDGSSFLKFQADGVDVMKFTPENSIVFTASCQLFAGQDLNLFSGPGAAVTLFGGDGDGGAGGDVKLTPGVGDGARDGLVILTLVPTADPEVLGALWNSSGTLMISEG